MSEYRKSSDNEILNDVYNREIPSTHHLRKYDSLSESGVNYLGYSPKGTLTSSNDWFVKKFDENNEEILTSNGAWDKHLTLIYS